MRAPLVCTKLSQSRLGPRAFFEVITCTISPLLDMQAIPGATQALLAKFEGWQARGAPLYAQTQTRPLDFTVKLSEGGEARFVWDADTRITGVLTPGARVTVRYVTADGGANRALQITVSRS